jgi:ElaA protein
MATDINWTTSAFQSLSNDDLYAILKLRCDVFVVEQHCPYPDLDDKDQQSFHLLGKKDGQLVAYARIIPPGISYLEASIGRVVTAPVARRGGIGRALMNQAIAEVVRLFNVTDIQIGAQQYLDTFYTSLGFRQVGEMYLEDGIPHIHMIFRK